MNNEENNLNNGTVQNINDNPEILESTPIDTPQPSNNVAQPSAPSNDAEVLTTENASAEQPQNDGTARIDTETAGEAHIHLEAYQTHEKKEKKAIVRTAEEEKGYSRRRVAMILFFVFLIAFVIFLPDIRNLYIQYKSHVEDYVTRPSEIETRLRNYVIMEEKQINNLIEDINSLIINNINKEINESYEKVLIY